MVARKENSSLLSYFLPLTAGTHRLYLRTEGSASLLCEKIIPPVDSWDPSHLVANLWAYKADVYTGLCQLNQQMILAAGPLDVNPTAVLLLQPLFLLLSPVGGTAAVLPRTRTSEVSHSSPSATPLPRLPHLRVVPVWVRSAWCGQQPRVIGR